MNSITKRYDNFFGDDKSRQLIKKQRELYKNQSLRINISKANKSKVKDYLKDKNVTFENTFIDNAFEIKKSFFSLATSVPALTSDFYMQELASQIPVNLIEFNKLKSNVKILDMAASPGSKLTQLIDRLNFHNISYSITALEPNQRRIQRLINNIQKQEGENVYIVNVSGEGFKSNTKFDLIMLDAPCSGNLITDVDWLKKRNEKGILEKAALQKKLIENAIKHLDKDGTLIYSTCSIEPEENEENILWAKEKLKLEEIETSFKFPFETNCSDFFTEEYQEKYRELKSIRIMPYETNTQGFFISLLKKKN